ncbi:MAG: phage holin family protein [Atopobiaceae bacterium]|nr:phage holin family protein [Atopobiaceae bacterium]
MRFMLRWLVTALAVAAAIWLVPGIQPVGMASVSGYTVEASYMGPILTALLLALVNMCVKPLMQLVSLPITCLTLGIFSLVINAMMLELASWLARNLFAVGISIDSFSSAILGALVISIVTALLGGITKD